MPLAERWIWERWTKQGAKWDFCVRFYPGRLLLCATVPVTMLWCQFYTSRIEVISKFSPSCQLYAPPSVFGFNVWCSKYDVILYTEKGSTVAQYLHLYTVTPETFCSNHTHTQTCGLWGIYIYGYPDSDLVQTAHENFGAICVCRNFNNRVDA